MRIPIMTPFFRELQKWVADSVGYEFEHWTKEECGRLLLGTLVYGDYVERFLQYCVPSLVSSLLGLGARPLLVVHTDEKGLARLQAGLTPFVEAMDLEVHPVVGDLMAKMEENINSRYILLGASELIHMKRAFFRGMHYHCLFPDVVYPKGYFESLDRITRGNVGVVLSHSINTSLEDVAPKLHPEMSAAALASLGIEHMHARQKPYVMNLRSGDYPIAPHFMYVGQSRVLVSGMHATATFFHNRVLGFSSLRLNTTLDAQIPMYIPSDVPIYWPKASDGMTLIELSDKKWDHLHRREGCDLKEVALRFWATAEGNRDYERILQGVAEFPLERPPWWALPDEGLEKGLQKIHAFVSDIYPEVDQAFELGGILEESGINGPLSLPQDRIRAHANAS